MESVYTILGTIAIIFIVVMLFNFMIFVHELGHFWAARWRGLYVDRFQIWFGKPLWKKKINGVQWGVGWIPAGGFVSLPQMAPMEAIEGEVELPPYLKPVTPVDKIIVAAAGPLASLALAFCFAIVVWMVGKPDSSFTNTTIGYVQPGSPAAEAGILPGDKILAIDGRPVSEWTNNDMSGVVQLTALGEQEKIKFLIQRPGAAEPIEIMSGFRIPETKWWQRKAMRQVGFLPEMSCVVGSVLEGSPAQKAGFQKGDTLLTLNGQKLWNPGSVVNVSKSGEPMTFDVRRADGTTEVLTVKPELPLNWMGMEGATPVLGLLWSADADVKTTMTYPSPFSQVWGSLVWMKDTLQKVIAPNSSVGMEHLTGPVGIVNFLYKLLNVENGWRWVLWFAVVLNVNLAVLNILPLPVVDGGHVLFNTLELIFKRPINAKFLEYIQFGFVMVILAFFLFVTTKDVGDLVPAEQKLPAPEFVPAGKA